MESPIRKYLKQKEYQRHKVLRRIKKRQQRKAELMLKIAEKQLKRKLPKMDDGSEPKIEYVDLVRVNPITGEALLSDNTTGSIILPEVSVRPEPKLTKSAFDGYTLYLDDLVSFVPVAGDTNDAINAGIALKNKDYSQATLLGTSLLLPNALEKPLKYVVKGGSKILKKIADSAIAQDAVHSFGILDITRNVPEITAENAARITPKQWTVAQDAAIARGDMVEAQRLRDLHFQVSAPNTVASVNGHPLQLYHGTDATFNAFDISKYGSTDGGTFGRGIYTTPVKEYAELYGKNNMPLYMKLDNPRDYRNFSIGDLLAEKIAFGDDFATGIGIDGVIGRPSWKGFKGLEEYVSHNPRNIKSSLPITHDDNGVRIPLGERDNFNINDIRYGLLAPLVGGTALLGYNSLGRSVDTYNKGKQPNIHINPANRGKFNALKRRTGKTTEQLTHSKNPLTRKRAIFAQNAKKWNHRK